MSESECSSNYIDDVVDNLDGTYTIKLHHGIQGGTVTTIQYLGDLTGDSFVEYIHHPANVDGSGTANHNDIIEVVDCLNRPGSCEDYEADIDVSGGQTFNDIIEEVDLLNGAGSYEQWFGTALPVNDGACPAYCESRDGGEERGGRGMQAAPEAEEDEWPFGPWFAEFIMAADPQGETGMEEFVVTVGALSGWCTEHLTTAEKEELIALLTDSEAEFASEAVKAMVPRIVAALE